MAQVFIYNSEQEAVNAIATLNEYYGIPKDAEAVTQTLCEYNVWNDKYIIRFDECMRVVFGEPTEIEIN